jgi:tetratricopeptide (TPR) repeat protein
MVVISPEAKKTRSLYSKAAAVATRAVTQGFHQPGCREFERRSTMKRSLVIVSIAVAVAVRFLAIAPAVIAQNGTDKRTESVAATQSNNVGVTYADSREYEKAIEAFKRALRLNPDDAIALYNLGCVYIRQRQFKQAIEPLREATRRLPDYTEAYVNLGYAYGQTSDYRAAIAAIRAATRLNPKDADVQYYLATLHLLNKDKDSALAQFGLLKALNPELAKLLYSMIYGDTLLVVKPDRRQRAAQNAQP